MWFFNKNKNNNSIPFVAPAEKHEHKWRDFSWYQISKWRDGYYDVYIYEPYVCVTCKERKNVELLHECGYCTFKNFNDVIKRILSPYANRLKPRAVVEDEVNDAILVDKEFVDAWDKLHKMNEDNFLKLHVSSSCSSSPDGRASDF